MNTKELKAFEAVYEEKSIHKASRALFITPQGLSRMIQNLEAELSTVLFERTKQGVIPTESADFLYEKVEEMVRQFEEIQSGISQFENQDKVLRIGYACGALNVLPITHIFRFMQENPHIKVHWCEYSNQEVVDKLLSSEIEYGFIIGNTEGKKIIQKHLVSRKVLLLVYEGHPFYNRKEVNIDMLKQEKLILMNEHFQMYHEFLKACQVRGFVPDVVGKTADGTFLFRLCNEKIGLALIPDFIMENFILDKVKAIPFEEDMRWNVTGAFKCDNKNYATIMKFDRYLKKYYD